MNLLRQLPGEHTLNPKGRVCFRVLVRAAEILEGVPEENNGDVNDFLERESKMFDDLLIKNNLQSLNDVEREDRESRQHTFVSLSFQKRVLESCIRMFNGRIDSTNLDFSNIQEQVYNSIRPRNNEEGRGNSPYLSPSPPRVFDNKNVDDYNTNKNNIMVYDSDVASNSSKTKNKNKGVELKKLLATSLHELQEYNDGGMFAKLPSTFSKQEIPNGKLSELPEAYLIAVFLRILHSLMCTPVNDYISKTVGAWIRDTDTFHQVCDVVLKVPSLQCHVVAKFLRILSLTFANFNPKSGDDVREFVVFLHHVARFVHSFVRPLEDMLRMSANQGLPTPIMVLMTEIARIIAQILQMLPYFDIWNGAPDVDQLKTAFASFVPPRFLQVIVGIVVHDLQFDSVSAKDAASKKMFAEESYQRCVMLEYCTLILTKIMHVDRQQGYTILEALSSVEVTMNKTIRRSWLQELLNSVRIQGYFYQLGAVNPY